MSSKKMRFELFNNGDKYTVIFEGQITRDKVIRLLDLVELLGGMPNQELSKNDSYKKFKIEKVRLIAEEKFRIKWFSSKDIKIEYEKEFNESISLSTVSTYLSRLSDRGHFIRNNNSNRLRYKVVNNITNFPIH